MSLEIVNTTTVPVKISEGSGGVFFLKGLVFPKKAFPLRSMYNRIDTYREYSLTTEPENLPVGSPFTSDDIREYSRIEIQETESPRADGPVWIGTPTTKRRGCKMFLLQLLDLHFKPGAALQIVNSLTTDLHVKIVEANADQTIADLAPGDKFSLSVHPGCCYRFTTSLGSVFRGTHNTEERAPQERLTSGDIAKFSKIEITDRYKEYYWIGYKDA